MSLNQLLSLDISQLEPVEVTEIERQRVKQYVLRQPKKAIRWKRLIISTAIATALIIMTGMTFPTITAKIPYLNDMISHIRGEEMTRFNKFLQSPNSVGAVQESNGIKVIIDKAMYDGRTVTISMIVETEHDFGGYLLLGSIKGKWLTLEGADSYSGGNGIRKVKNTNYYAGILNITPHYPNNVFPENINVTINPTYFYDWDFFSTNYNLAISGEWLFELSLDSQKSTLVPINQTVKNDMVSFTIHSLEFTEISTIMEYEQQSTPELHAEIGPVIPTFYIEDNLGNVYMSELEPGGSGISYSNEQLLHRDKLSLGVIHDQATHLIITPTSRKSLMSELNQITLDPIIINLKELNLDQQ